MAIGEEPCDITTLTKNLPGIKVAPIKPELPGLIFSPAPDCFPYEPSTRGSRSGQGGPTRAGGCQGERITGWHGSDQLARRVVFLDDTDRAAVGGVEFGLGVYTQLVVEHGGQVVGRHRPVDW
jgi:hypothetical protein